MATEVKKEIELEIAYVLFLDLVDCSQLSVDEQHAGISELNEVVRLSEQFRKAEAANYILNRSCLRPQTISDIRCYFAASTKDVFR